MIKPAQAKRKRLSDAEWLAKYARTIRAKPKAKPTRAPKAKPTRKPTRAPKAKPTRAPKKRRRNRRRLPVPPKRIPFASPHTTRYERAKMERVGYYIVIHGAVTGGWESDSTPVFYEEADTKQYHVIIWRTKVFNTIEQCINAYLDLIHLEKETGVSLERGIEILWSELMTLYPDHIHVRLHKWIGDDYPHYDF